MTAPTWFAARGHATPTEKLILKKHLLDEQQGCCAICGAIWTGTWCLDHDHNCCGPNRMCQKCVRGVLCSACNTGIGMLRDDPETLLRAVEYIQRGGTA